MNTNLNTNLDTIKSGKSLLSTKLSQLHQVVSFLTILSILGYIICFVGWVLTMLRSFVLLFTSIGCFLLMILLGTTSRVASMPRFINHVESVETTLDSNFVTMINAVLPRDAKQFVEQVESIKRILLPSEIPQGMVTSRLSKIAILSLRKLLLKKHARTFDRFLSRSCEDFEVSAAPRLAGIERGTKSGNLVASSRDIECLKALADVFEPRSQYLQRISFRTNISRLENAIASANTQIRKDFDANLNQARTLEMDGKISAAIRLVKLVREKAVSAGMQDALKATQAMLDDMERSAHRKLRPRLDAMKETLLKEGQGEKSLRDAKEELVSIKQIATELSTTSIKNEAEYWLANIDMVTKIVDIFKDVAEIKVMDLQKNLHVEKSEFSAFLIDWAAPLSLTIENGIVHRDKGDISSMIKKIDEMFASWRENEDDPNSKKI